MKRKLIVGLMIAVLATLLLGCDSEEVVEVDVTAPVISDIIVSNITESSATITWTTDEPARGNVRWMRSGAGVGVSFFEDTEESTSHSVILEGLKPDTVYCFRVIAKDASGNKATSEDRCFTTAIGGDS